jgi:hypothetical protein
VSIIADSHYIGVHDDVKCLSSLDLSYYKFINCSKDGFVPSIIKTMSNWLNHLM